MYDSVNPASLPHHHVIATYATGPYAVPAARVRHRPVVWIDTTGTDPGAAVLDVEPTDATPAMAATWVREKLTAKPGKLAVIYCSISEWSQVRAAVAVLPRAMRSHIRWWIANPTGHPHVVPGSSATQWYWGNNYDISTVMPRF